MRELIIGIVLILLAVLVIPGVIGTICMILGVVLAVVGALQLAGVRW